MVLIADPGSPTPDRPALGVEADRPVAAARIRVGGRLPALDGLRFLAAMAVLSYHYFAYGDGVRVWGVHPSVVFPHLSVPASYGWLGVQVFFLISGFVICMSAWGRGLGEFFVSRATRLYPAYWVSIVLVTAVATLWPIIAQARPPREVLVNLTMLEAPMGVPYVDGVYWTLWYELLFYLLFSVVVWRGLTYSRVVAFCMIWTMAAVLLPPLRIPVVSWFASPDSAPYFIGGICCYLIYRFGFSWLLFGLLGVNWIIAVYRIYPTVVAHVKILGPGAPAKSWPAVAIITAAYAFVLAVALGRFAWVRWKWLTVAGALTYPVYLLHEYLGWTAIREMKDHLPAWLIVTIVTSCVLVLAWLVHKLVERPASRWMRDRLLRGITELRKADPAKVVPTREALRGGPRRSGASHRL